MTKFKDWVSGRSAVTIADADELYVRDDDTDTSKQIAWSSVKTALASVFPTSATLTTDGDILTRAAGIPARITRADLATDLADETAFTSQYAPLVYAQAGAVPPNGAVTGSVGDRYIDTAATLGARVWYKASGSATNTGWLVAEGDTGWRNMTAELVGGWTAGKVSLRRINNTVEWRFQTLNESASSATALMTVPDGFLPLISSAADSRISTILYSGSDGSSYTATSIVMIGITGTSANSIRSADSFTTASGSMMYTTLSGWPSSLPGT